MSAHEQNLLELYRQLGPGDQSALLAFAEFLQQRGVPAASSDPITPAELPEPVSIARPEQESVVSGLKRLSQTYPMLDKSEMLNATSDLVARHIMQGTGAAEVIDKLEDIFSEHYRQLRESPDA